MDTKQYLNQISRYDRLINNKLLEISELRELAYGISAITNKERIQSTPDYDRLGSAICKIEKMETQLDKMIDRYFDMKNTIIEQIGSIEDEIYYSILFSKYVEKKSFEKIADELQYSFRNTTRLHGRALQEFERKYGQTYLKL